jgi:hypothetical protein
MPLPYQGNPGVFNYNGNPTLIPNFYPNYMNSSGTTMDAMSPAQYMANNPATAASATATIAGTITAGDTVTLKVTQPQLPGGSVSYTYTVVTSDTVQDVAEGLASGLDLALTNAGAAQAYVETGDTTLASEAVVTVYWTGQMGNSAVLSTTKSGGATETVTLAPTSGIMSGGSGPVMAVNNFSFSYNNVTLAFVAGKLMNVDSGLAAALAAQDMPVV